MDTSAAGICGSSAVCELFADRVRLMPDGRAVAGERETLTYRELDERSKRFAATLARLGVRREDRVALLVEPTADLITATLGVIRAGGAYVGIDPAWPVPVMAATLRDCGARALVVSGDVPREVAAIAPTVLDLEAALGSSHGLPAIERIAEQLFCVVYTSGTSGSPKGVLIPERAVVNRLRWVWSDQPYRPGDVSLVYRSHAAIGFTWDCFAPLLQGVPIVMAVPASMRAPRDFLATCVKYGVSHVSASPGRWDAILDHLERHAASWPTFRLARCSGEPLRSDLLVRWRRLLPHVPLRNIYGASECSSMTAFDPLSFLPSANAPIPVGSPITNLSVYVVDDEMAPVPAGERGEVCAAGECVARGYLNRPRLTAEHFVPDPFGVGPGGRIYRTGDIGRWQSEGVLEIVGRRNRVVKVRGFRVELGELEAAIQGCDGVRAAAVVAEEPIPGECRLVAYVVVHDEHEWSSSKLRAALEARIPDHMIPAELVRVEEMPLTSTGKIARSRLARPQGGQPDRSSASPLATATERTLAAIWCEVLALDHVDADDDFFELGGNSIKGIQILTRVFDVFGVDLALDALLDCPTVRLLAGALESASPALPEPAASTSIA